jgi:hypothetical protein
VPSHVDAGRDNRAALPPAPVLTTGVVLCSRSDLDRRRACSQTEAETWRSQFAPVGSPSDRLEHRRAERYGGRLADVRPRSRGGSRAASCRRAKALATPRLGVRSEREGGVTSLLASARVPTTASVVATADRDPRGRQHGRREHAPADAERGCRLALHGPATKLTFDPLPGGRADLGLFGRLCATDRTPAAGGRVVPSRVTPTAWREQRALYERAQQP